MFGEILIFTSSLHNHHYIRDYYETDKDHHDLYRLWGNRAGIHPTTPVIFLQRNEETRAKINTEFESVGLGTVGFNADPLRSLLPDTDERTAEDLSESLRYYKCSGEVETSGICETNKYSTGGAPCDLSEHQAKARSGWKDHRLIGRAIGSFLVRMLRESLDELRDLPLTAETVHNLTSYQVKDHLAYRSSTLHDTHKGSKLGRNTDFLGGHGMYSPFWKANAFCRSALLPNQARYDGISTLGNKGIRHDGGFYTGYDVGNSITHLPKPNPNQPTDIQLAFLPESRRNCSSIVHIDYKDFFVVRREDEVVKVVIPNEAERKQFHRVRADNRGAHAIVLCDSQCEAGKCEDDIVSIAEIAAKDKLSIKVDGAGIVSVKSLSLEPSICHLLIGDHDSFLWVNKRGQFELDIQLHTEGTLRLSSIIVI